MASPLISSDSVVIGLDCGCFEGRGVTGLLEGYQNIHLNPLFRHRIAYGTSGFPWTGLRSGDSKFIMAQAYVQLQSICIRIPLLVSILRSRVHRSRSGCSDNRLEKVWNDLLNTAL